MFFVFVFSQLFFFLYNVIEVSHEVLLLYLTYMCYHGNIVVEQKKLFLKKFDYLFSSSLETAPYYVDI